jgi:hypothetical protein
LEFTIGVENTSAEDVTLTSLIDDVFGDLLVGPLAPEVTDNTCDDALPVTIVASATFTCTVDAGLVGNFGDPDHINIVSATVDDGEGNTVTAPLRIVVLRRLWSPRRLRWVRSPNRVGR